MASRWGIRESSGHRKEAAKVRLRKPVRDFLHSLGFSIKVTRYGKTDGFKDALVIKKCKEINTLKVRTVIWEGGRVYDWDRPLKGLRG